MRAMVVDSSDAIRQVVKNMLKEIGFEIREARSPAQALERLDDSPDVDLLVCDWPADTDAGVDFLRTLRSDPALAHLRIVVTASSRDEASLELARHAGADEWIARPFTKDVLSGALDRMEIRP